MSEKLKLEYELSCIMSSDIFSPKCIFFSIYNHFVVKYKYPYEILSRILLSDQMLPMLVRSTASKMSNLLDRLYVRSAT